MEVMKVLHMNKGEGETSYAKNSTIQKNIISLATSTIEEAIVHALGIDFPKSMGIADLGCSSGPNALTAILNIINTVYEKAGELRSPLPELRISLNDLPSNDFNNVLLSLPQFYKKLEMEKKIGPKDCFISTVGGSFYGRLFPRKSLHFVHSSSSLHWLSQVPTTLVSSFPRPLNKGKIYISKTSQSCVKQAYLSQFNRDFSLFLKSRSEEIVHGGAMVLSFMGRVSAEPSSEECCMHWEIMSQALMTMALEGLVEEEKIDSFNVPYYAPSTMEVTSAIEEEGSFIIDRLEAFEIDWDASSFSSNVVNNSDEKNDDERIEKYKLSRGEQVAKTHRAVIESMVECHFGKEIMDEFFRRYGELVDYHFSRTKLRFIDLVISLTKMG